MENSTHKALNFLNRKPNCRKVRSFSLVKPEPQIPAITLPEVQSADHHTPHVIHVEIHLLNKVNLKFKYMWTYTHTHPQTHART